MPALVAAWKITGQKKYAAHAADHLRTWFVTPATRMNPNLQYAQAVHGAAPAATTASSTPYTSSRSPALSPSCNPPARSHPPTDDAVIAWFRDYLTWLTTSERGKQERDTKNNHATTWLMQAAEFARLTSNSDVTNDCRNRLRTIIIPNQIAPDGSFPARARSHQALQLFALQS